jgi:hypothetical protein
MGKSFTAVYGLAVLAVFIIAVLAEELDRTIAFSLMVIAQTLLWDRFDRLDGER